MSPSHLGTLLSVAALFTFAISTLTTRLASDRVDSSLGFLIATTMNVLLCGAAVLVHALIRAEPAVFDLRAFWMFVTAGFFTTFLGRYFFFESVVRMGAARASTFGTTSPMFSALFGWLFLGDIVSGPSLVAMILVLLGLALVANKGPSKPSVSKATGPDIESPIAARPVESWGSLMALGLGSSAAYAIGNVLRAEGVRSWNEPIIGALIGAATALVLQLAFSARRSGVIAKLKAADPTGFRLFIAVGSANITAQVLTIAAIRYLPVAEVVLITSATPLIVFPLSYLFLQRSESITPMSVLGLLLSLAGVGYLVGRPLLA